MVIAMKPQTGKRLLEVGLRSDWACATQGLFSAESVKLTI
jgi:hypothetical protein